MVFGLGLLWLEWGAHYKKNSNYRRSKSVGNTINPLVLMFYRRISNDTKSVRKHIIGNALPTDFKSPLVIFDGGIHRSNRRPFLTDHTVGNYRRLHLSEKSYVHLCHYRRIYPLVIIKG